MQTWQETLLSTIGDSTLSEAEVFDYAVRAAAALGFEFCAYGVRLPLPYARPQTAMVSNYPAEWQRRYHEARYVTVDPTVSGGQGSTSPIIWSDQLFSTTPTLWDEARAFNLRVGWAQSCLDGARSGLLTLARSCGELSEAELSANGLAMRWLANISHLALARRLVSQLTAVPPELTAREIEILRWSADGKTAPEIGDILDLADSTVVFHVANAMRKLNVSSRTAATVKAAMLGLLG